MGLSPLFVNYRKTRPHYLRQRGIGDIWRKEAKIPRDGSGVYSAPAGTTVTTGTTIESAPYNAFVADLVSDANTVRPVVAGGTGVSTVGAAQTAFKIPPFDGTATISGAWTFTANQKFNDSVKALFGTGSDLEIYHNGTGSVIADVGVGGLVVSGSTVDIQSTAGASMIRARTGLEATLYYDGNAKIVTTSTGATITGLLSGDTIGGAMVSTDISADTGSTDKVPNVDAVETAIAAGATQWAVDSARTISAASTFTWAHGLGSIPTLVQAELVCQTGEFNYTAGQVIQVPIGVDASNRGISVIKDATNLVVRIGSGSAIMAYPNATTGAGAALTYANWQLRMRAAV